MEFKLVGDKVVETPELMYLLKEVNKKFNKFPYISDVSQHHETDYWTARIDLFEAGDCDDFALAKRKALIEEGVPFECLKPTICKVDEEGHLVLICRTTNNDYVLDNLRQTVVPVKRLDDYKWLYSLNPVEKQWEKLF
jgi:predicted transglutaminase-like cysteine proteinase